MIGRYAVIGIATGIVAEPGIMAGSVPLANHLLV